MIKRFAFIFMFGLIMFTLIITSMSMYSQTKQIIEKLDSIESRLEGDNCFIYYGTEVGYVNLPCPDDLYGEHDRP